MSKNIVSVYDTITKRYVEIEVSEKIRTYYNRTQWNIDDNNKSFYKHEIQFSALKGNINGELENFQEFRTENDDVERRVIQNIKFEKLYSCLNELSDDEILNALVEYPKLIQRPIVTDGKSGIVGRPKELVENFIK